MTIGIAANGSGLGRLVSHVVVRGLSEPDNAEHDRARPSDLEHLRQALIDQAQTGSTTTYGEFANRLGLEPPNTIRRIIEALEDLMAEDVAAGRPILAAICVSKARTGIPQPGFFLTAQALGVFSGDPTGPEAFAFHARELQRVLSLYGH